MTSRRQKRQELRAGLDGLRMRMDEKGSAPRFDRALLTSVEAKRFDELNRRWQRDGNFKSFSYLELTVMRALLKKGYGLLTRENADGDIREDNADIAILTEINKEISP